MTKKILFSTILFLGLAAGKAALAGEALPTISISPESYSAGEETLYLQGRAEPNESLYIFLKDGEGREIEKWPVQSDASGDWSFLSKDLARTGEYTFSAGVQRDGGIIFSEEKPVEIFLNGFFLFGLGISFKNLIFALIILSVFSFAVFWVFSIKLKKTKRKIRKEVEEARDICGIVFGSLKEKIEKRIEFVDSQPGFSLEEKKACDDLNKFLNAARSSIEKEINDVEKLIK